MFGIETNQQQINKLDKIVRDIKREVDGGLFDASVRDILEHHSKALGKLTDRIEALENIIKKSGIVEELDTTDVVDIPFQTLLGTHKQQFIVNKVKVN